MSEHCASPRWARRESPQTHRAYSSSTDLEEAPQAYSTSIGVAWPGGSAGHIQPPEGRCVWGRQPVEPIERTGAPRFVLPVAARRR